MQENAVMKVSSVAGLAALARGQRLVPIPFWQSLVTAWDAFNNVNIINNIRYTFRKE